jgi:quinoprotein glucose dehydrogenase
MRAVSIVLKVIAIVLYVIAFASALPAAPQDTSQTAGRTVWDGVFTEEQAARGRVQFGEHCAECHGSNLQGGQAKALSGERFWVDFKESPLDYLLRQISTNMPFSEDGSLAGSLSASAYADIVAHILKVNGFPAGDRELTRAATAGVQIVGKEGPGELPAGAIAHVVGCLTRAADGSWRITSGAAPARLLSGQPPDVRRPLGTREYALMFVITRLDKFVGHRMSVTGRLIGEGGNGGINVTNVSSVAATCE